MTLDHSPDRAPTPPDFAHVSIGTSLGGLQALSELLGCLPADFPASLTVVQHLEPRSRSMLSDILSRRVGIAVVEAQDGAKLMPGTVHVAPPNHHLQVAPDGTLRLDQSPRLHFARPAVDRLFRSTAAAFGGRLIGVLMTGHGTDGAEGARAIRSAGGVMIVQDPDTARAPSMCRAAIAAGCADFVLPVGGIGLALRALLATPGTAAMFGLPRRVASAA